MPILIDSYSETNQNASRALYNTDSIASGQSFLNPTSCVLDSAKAYLKKDAGSTGNIYAKIYAMTGTFGTDSKPTGAALATSAVYNLGDLTTSFQLITFSFSGANRITLSDNTHYVLVITVDGNDVNHELYIGIDTTVHASHAGNNSTSTDETVWTSFSGADQCFYVYREDGGAAGMMMAND